MTGLRGTATLARNALRGNPLDRAIHLLSAQQPASGRNPDASNRIRISEKMKSGAASCNRPRPFTGPAANLAQTQRCNMPYRKYDPWQEVANNAGGGLKFGKGRWTLDNDEVETGENGLGLYVLMDTAIHGTVKWSNERITERRTQSYLRVAPTSEPLELGWSPYTSVQCIGANGEYVEQLVTFSSTTWGGRNAFHGLVRLWVRKGQREFPICTLGSKPKKNDPNGNVDPTFMIVGWALRSDFAAFLPPDDEPPPTSGEAAPIDDDLPF